MIYLCDFRSMVCNGEEDPTSPFNGLTLGGDFVRPKDSNKKSRDYT